MIICSFVWYLVLEGICVNVVIFGLVVSVIMD